MESAVITALAAIGGVVLGAYLTRKNALAVAELSAKTAREQELERERRALARDRLERQFEARLAVQRFVLNNLNGPGWSDPGVREEAAQIAGRVASAFTAPRFAAFLYEVLFYEVALPIRPGMFQKAPRTMTESQLLALWNRSDKEMLRVIEETVRVSGYGELEIPKVPSKDEAVKEAPRTRIASLSAASASEPTAADPEASEEAAALSDSRRARGG